MSFVAQAEDTSTIQFDRMVYDFGKTSRATVSGVFKFKNNGTGNLKVEPPKPSCGCTVAGLKSDTLAPGATGELDFTLNLGLYRTILEKHISVWSNDPQTPEVWLTIKADYTPLYDLDPTILSPHLAFGVKDAVQFTTLTRTDGQSLRIARLETSQPWITATVEPGAKANEATARICIAIQRDGSPRRFIEHVDVYAAGQTNTPATSIYLYGQVMGEVSLEPEALYWSIPDAAETPAENPEAMIPRRVTIRSANGQAFALKNPQSTLKGIEVELVPKEDGKVFELVAQLHEAPTNTVRGSVSFETSVATQPRIEVPITVYVFKP